MRMISFNRRYVAGSESNQRHLDPQSDSLSMLGVQLQGIHEPPHDKTNKMAIAPSEDTDQPVHPPSLIRVFAVRMKKHWVLSYPLSALRILWSDWADDQADISLRWAQRPFCWFCHEVAHIQKVHPLSSLVASEINHSFEGRALTAEPRIAS